jgi:hypothetical protein
MQYYLISLALQEREDLQEIIYLTYLITKIPQLGFLPILARN